eukprot:CAMPEP_0115890702 /NCGR_PEP_ID=MMETSP0287-20121206/33485_1 /TAXON_ID=412157 /ORGANISM="Chrysochromulina rotalis, Strain UIO044" /LENGTH=55 /DNA_ID=CAMNT_0003347477 /DNA_START=379 /DNA_END=546 /DNA_ORIENTATION=+
MANNETSAKDKSLPQTNGPPDASKASSVRCITSSNFAVGPTMYVTSLPMSKERQK